MKDNFDYHSVPYAFVHCLNSACPRAGECLRHQVALRIPADVEAVMMMNPCRIYSDKTPCSGFLPDVQKKFARGMTHMFDLLPHKDAILIKKQMLNYFGKTLFYRLFRKEYLFTPTHQRYIRRLFKAAGLESEPVYDEIVDSYEW